MGEKIQSLDSLQEYVLGQFETPPLFLLSSFDLIRHMIKEDSINEQILKMADISDSIIARTFLLQVLFPQTLWGSNSLFNVNDMDVLVEKQLVSEPELEELKNYVERRQDET